MVHSILYQGQCCGFSMLKIVESANNKVVRKSNVAGMASVVKMGMTKQQTLHQKVQDHLVHPCKNGEPQTQWRHLINVLFNCTGRHIIFKMFQS